VTVIANVTTADPRAPLSRLLTAPLGLDVWETGEEHLVLRATEAQLERLTRMGYAVEQLQPAETFLSAFATDEALAGYHSAETLEQDMRQLAERHAEIAELHEIGRSLEARPIWALRIGDRRGSDRKVLFLGCHHAREWVAVEVPYLLAEHLVDNATSPDVQDLLSRGEVWVAPMVNPDGHEYSRTRERLWRKNRRPNPDGSFGVDPNRNYGYMWGTLDVSTSSHVPSDETYVGPRAFSEPETRAVRDLVARELFGGVVTFHSYSQLILYPWGYSTLPIADPVDLADMEGLGGRMKTAIHGVHGETYRLQRSSQLYPTAGDTTDWTYGEYDIPSFTIELRPDTVREGAFILPPAQIQPTWEENRPAALEFMKHVIQAGDGT